MNQSAFCRVAAVAFGVLALAQATRLLLRLPVVIGTAAEPLWVSGLGVLILGALSFLGFRARSQI